MSTDKLLLKLRFMGFCGVDDSVDPQLLSVLSYHYPFVEWGILFRPDLEGQPRYATAEWIEKLSKVKTDSYHDIHLAGHFCGSRCEEILHGEFSFVQEVYNRGFRRIQINATRTNNVKIDMYKKAEVIENLRQCILHYPSIEWMIQANQETMFIVNELKNNNPPSNMTLLYDSSCGLGIPISADSLIIPTPLDTISCGYAGGIGPTTIDKILRLLNDKITSSELNNEILISNNHIKPIWIDMESSLRETIRIAGTITADSNGTIDDINKNYELKDVFSISKCFECIQVGVALLNLPVR